jgi:hypothetical protein
MAKFWLITPVAHPKDDDACGNYRMYGRENRLLRETYTKEECHLLGCDAVWLL